MKKFDINNLTIYLCVGLVGLIIATKYYPQNKTAVAESSKAVIKSKSNAADNDSEAAAQNETPTQPETATNATANQRNLKLTVVVDNPGFLKVKVGDIIKTGQIITDNTLERDRLSKQRKSLSLQIDNLKNKLIPQPFELKVNPAAGKLPSAKFLEEEAAIAQSELKLSQARGILAGRTPLLQSDNPQVRAESERAEAGLQAATQKVDEQEQLIASMKDLKLQPAILEHEEAKLKQIRSEYDQQRSVYEMSRAKLNSSGIEQQQELQQLSLSVRLAESELLLANSKLATSRERRGLLEYESSVETIKRSQLQQQLEQEHSRQQQQYAENLRDKDYQLAQLNILLTNIDDRLAQIPLLRSPREGYIKRIKPWVGNNGKYSTTITIASNLSSKNGDSNSASVTSSTQKPKSTIKP